MVVAVVCALIGVASGFCTYLIVANLLSEPGGIFKLLGVGVGLLVAIAVSAFVDWLREIIDRGEGKLPLPSWRTLPRLLLIILLFEIAVTIFHEAASQSIGEFDHLKSIASEIAGHGAADIGTGLSIEDIVSLRDFEPDRLSSLKNSSWSADKSKAQQMGALLTTEDRIEHDTQTFGSIGNPFESAPTPYVRLAKFMTLAEQMIGLLVPKTKRGGEPFSDQTIQYFHSDLLSDPDFKPLPKSPPGEPPPPGPVWPVVLPNWAVACGAKAIETGDATSIKACRNALMGVDAAFGHQLVSEGLNRELFNPLLYESDTFANVEFEPGLKAELEALVCDFMKDHQLDKRFKIEHPYCSGDQNDSPEARLPEGPERDLAIVTLNHRLLNTAGVPLFRPLSTLWTDFWMLTAFWCRRDRRCRLAHRRHFWWRNPRIEHDGKNGRRLTEPSATWGRRCTHRRRPACDRFGTAAFA
jgi:hypothetical protein